MNLEAAGAYLEELRKARKVSRRAVSDAVGVTDDIILRIEKGRGETAGSVLLRIVHYLGGSYEDLRVLFDDLGATATEGQQRARDWLQRQAFGTAGLDPAVLEKYDVKGEILRIADLPTLEEREAELRKLPPEVFDALETVALDLMRVTLLRRRG